MDFQLNVIDLIVMAAYMVGIVYIGLRLSGKHEDVDDYFLAGRKMIWPVVGVSLFASNISSTTLIGLSGDAYGKGISVYNYEWMAALVLGFFAVFFLPFYIKSKVYTMPEFLEKRYDVVSRYYFSAITIVANIIIDTAGGLYAGGLVLKMIFPEFPMSGMIMALAIFAGTYTIVGGLRAVMITDVIQTVILFVGSIVMAWFAYEQILDHGGWEVLKETVNMKNEGMLSLWRPLDDPNVPWLGLLTGVPLLGFYFWCTNQFMVQRILSAKDINHGRWGALFAGLLKLPVLFIMVLPGTMAILLFPELPKQDLVYPTLIFSLLPIGLRGLVVAGLMAALMSSIDSTLNSASTLVTMDFVKKIKPGYSKEKLMKIGRMFTFIFMVAAALWAPIIIKVGSLFQYLQIVLSYLTPPVISLFIIGLFWKRANAAGAKSALFSGLIMGVLLFIMNVLGLSPHWLHFLYVAFILFIVSSIVLVLVSLCSQKPAQEKTENLVWSIKVYQSETRELKETPICKNYRWQTLALFIITVVLLCFFW